MTHILIFDGTPAAMRRDIEAHAGPSNQVLFETALGLHASDVECLTLNVADGEPLPPGVGVSDFDGAIITGSPLNIYHDVLPVRRQIEFAREVLGAGIPVYGSCWGIQLGTVALGGTVRLNPNGRELGIARTVRLSPAGRDHPVFAGKADVFDALCSHTDEVETLPPGSRVLALNGVSAVQAVEIERDGASFVGVQYHPEHTFGTTAAIVELLAETLVIEGLGRSTAELEPLIADLRALDADPGRRDLAWRYGLDRHVLDPALRTAEIRNWLRARVLPRRETRVAA